MSGIESASPDGAGPRNTADIADALRGRLAGALIALDFDGTLAPIVRDPEDSRTVDGTVDALIALTRAGADVVIITGRDARTALRLGGLDAVPGIRVEGLYGVESWHDGALDTPDTPDVIEALRDQLPAALASADPDVWIEDKRLSLVVHTRKTADPAGERDRIAPGITAVGERLGFLVEFGNGVVEFRLPGFDKGAVLTRLAAGHDGVLYVGDDIGDLPAFDAIRRLRADGVVAYGVAVEASGVPEAASAADVSVADPGAVVALLRELLPDPGVERGEGPLGEP